MSTTSAYFIPKNAYTVGHFKKRVKVTLLKLHIIDGYYDKEDELYAHGESIAFEYASIHDTDKNKLVPEAASAGYGATCPQCNADTDEELYNTINDYYDSEEESGEQSMSELVLTCNHCHKSMMLKEVVFTESVVLTNQFFQFVDIEDAVPIELITQMEQKLKTQLVVIYERM